MRSETTHIYPRIITEKMIKAMERSVSTWYEMLLFIEGELELSKCEWYLIDWTFDSKEKPFKKHFQRGLFIRTSERKEIESKQ